MLLSDFVHCAAHVFSQVMALTILQLNPVNVNIKPTIKLSFASLLDQPQERKTKTNKKDKGNPDYFAHSLKIALWFSNASCSKKIQANGQEN